MSACAARGSHVWALRTLYSFGIGSLLNDLVRFEEEGLANDRCQKVQEGFDKAIQISEQIPDSAFRTAHLAHDLRRIKQAYVKWNSVTGAEYEHRQARQQCLVRLRKKKRKMINRFAQNQCCLGGERMKAALTATILRDIMGGFEDLSRELPDVFPSVQQTLREFDELASPYGTLQA